ncbi:MAG: hypothetical protein IT374_02780 [Polyangiaceae bacterium]|nr:hypothetical protein [Polyangiaceae bacterium]
MEFVAVALIVAVLALQVFTTLRLRRSPSCSAEQKRVQTSLVWLVPVLGAVMVLSVLHQDGELFQKSSSSHVDRG